MFEVKQNLATRVPVRIFDTNGNPVAGVVFGAVTVTVVKADNITASYTPVTGDWAEITTGAAANQGLYQLQFKTTDTSVTGPLIYCVNTATSKTFVGSIKVVANEEVDTFSRIGAPVGASISADIASVKSSVGSVTGSVGSVTGSVGSVTGN